jgi:hypothetical protein
LGYFSVTDRKPRVIFFSLDDEERKNAEFFLGCGINTVELNYATHSKQAFIISLLDV